MYPPSYFAPTYWPPTYFPVGGSGVTPTYGSPDEYLTLTTWSDPDPSLTTTEAFDGAADDGMADASLTLTSWE